MEWDKKIPLGRHDSYNSMFTESRKKNERSFFLLTPFAALYMVPHYENSGVRQTGM
jgi:hypothetical protein